VRFEPPDPCSRTSHARGPCHDARNAAAVSLAAPGSISGFPGADCAGGMNSGDRSTIPEENDLCPKGVINALWEFGPPRF
jgi:hypothetical protein